MDEADFIHVIETYKIRQRQAGNREDLSVLVNNFSAGSHTGGFNWQRTPEGYSYWVDILSRPDFQLSLKDFVYKMENGVKCPKCADHVQPVPLDTNAITGLMGVVVHEGCCHFKGSTVLMDLNSTVC